MTVDDDLARLRLLLDETAEQGEQRLPPEPQLSNLLGVSRGRLRTLLKKLEDEGAIWRHVGKGTFIGAQRMTGAGAPASSFSVGDIFDARLTLEPQLAALAAVHATSSDVAALDNCLGEMAGSESFIQWKRLDERLHREIAKATHNVLLLLLFDTLRAQMTSTLDRRLDQVFGADQEPKTDTDVEHAAIVEAIRNHDPVEAERLARDHLHSVRQKLFGTRLYD